MSRPRADTMPVVTVPPRPNGLPTAITDWPTRILLASPNSTYGSGLSAFTCRTREIGLGVGAQQLGRELAAVRQGDGDLLGIARHVIVRDDDAGWIDDEARADGLLLGLRPLLDLALLAEALGELAHEFFHLRLTGLRAGIVVVAGHLELFVARTGLHRDGHVHDRRRHLGGKVGKVMSRFARDGGGRDQHRGNEGGGGQRCRKRQCR